MMKEWRRRDIVGLLLESGAIAMRGYDAPHRSFKDDDSIVTGADTEIEDFLTRELNCPEEGSFIIGEETAGTYSDEYLAAALRKTAWVIDPIDGTSPYANQIPTWGVSIALMENSVIREGAIYLPAMNELYITDGDSLLWTPSCPKHPAAVSAALRPLPPFEKRCDASGIIGLSQKIAKAGFYRGPHSVQAVSSCVFSMTGLLTGRYAGYLATVKLWDIAAGLVMVLRRGFCSQMLTGAPLGLEVNESFYELDPASKRRWRLHGHAVFAPDADAAEEILRYSELPR